MLLVIFNPESGRKRSGTLLKRWKNIYVKKAGMK